MRTQSVVIACIIALASLVLAWATMPAGPRGNAPPIAPVETFALGFDVPSVRALTVTSAGLEASISGEPAWVLTLPASDGATPDSPPHSAPRSARWPANADAVRVLFNDLSTQRIEAAQHGPPAGDPLATITIETASDRITIEILGPPLAGRLPLRLTTRNAEHPEGEARDGFVPADRFRPTDAGQLAALADPKPFNTEGVITAVTVTPGQGQPVTIQREAGVWTVPLAADPGRRPRIHQPTARAIVEDLRRVRATNVIVPMNPEALNGAPFLTIETTADLPRPRGTSPRTIDASLTIMGQTTVDGAYDALATRSSPDGAPDQQLQIRLDPASFPVLPADLNTLLDPVPLPWSLTDTARLRIDLPDSPVTLTRTIDGWTRDRRPLSGPQLDALAWLFETLTATAASVRSQPATPATSADIGLRVEAISSSAPIDVRILPSPDGVHVLITDGAALWTMRADPARLDALAQIFPAAPRP